MIDRNSLTAAFALNDQKQDEQQEASAVNEALQTGAYPQLLRTLSELKQPLDRDNAFEQGIRTYLHGIGVGVGKY